MGLFGKKRSPPPSPPAALEADIHARVEQAMEMAAQLREQFAAAAGSSASPLVSAPQTDYVKQCDCPSCGAPKKLPSPTAYLYCDYCGALADYDFRKACERATPPGPAYMQLIREVQPQLAAAKGDAAAYRALQERIFDTWVTECPNAVSHRVGDPTYRGQLVAYLAESAVTTDLDPGYDELMTVMTQRVGALEWTGGFTSRQVGSASFRSLWEVVAQQGQRATELLTAAGTYGLDPDQAAPAVRDRLRNSMFCQGWMPYLSTEDSEWLLHQTGLHGEYTHIEPDAGGAQSACGSCGGAITALPGATRVVCDHCGHAVDVGGAQSVCGSCGGPISFPVGVTRLQCPHCKAETARV